MILVKVNIFIHIFKLKITIKIITPSVLIYKFLINTSTLSNNLIFNNLWCWCLFTAIYTIIIIEIRIPDLSIEFIIKSDVQTLL